MNKIQIVIPQHSNMTAQFEDCEMVPPERLNDLEPSSCMLLHLGNCCDFLINRFQVLQVAISKLRYGGHIIVEGTDYIDTAYAIVRGELNLEDVSTLLFYGRTNCVDFQTAKTQLQQFGLSIISNRLMQHKYSIRAMRPKPQLN